MGERKQMLTLWVILFIGCVIRTIAILQSIAALENFSLGSFLSLRPEISTVPTSWRNLREGLHLMSHGYSPYVSDICHSNPLLLGLFHQIPQTYILGLLTLMDLFTAHNLYIICFLVQEELSVLNNFNILNEISMTPQSIAFPLFCSAFYFMNPLVVGVTSSLSTSSFAHATVSGAILFALRGNISASASFLALATILDVYPILLLPVLILLVTRSSRWEDRSKILLGISYVFVFFIGCFALILLSYQAVGNRWDFVSNFYVFMFEGKDHFPNLGPWWYMSTLLFPRFISFFTIVFQTQPIVFVVPFLIRFKRYPMFIVYLLIHLSTIFRSYPTISDSIFALSFLIMNMSLLNHIKYTFYVAVLWVFGLSWCGFTWYSWISTGSGNPNFYYFGSTMHGICSLYVLSGSIAAMRRHFAHDLGIQKDSSYPDAEESEPKEVDDE